MSKNAYIHSKVVYREGDGPNIIIPKGPCEIEETAQDVTISWADGDTHGATAIPISDFKRYVASKAIEILEPKPA
ncbi:MAG: hypothetical protein H7Y33_02560 [Cytophagales bacterium]|nr:hypothetical protein [Rhizobacter sp.]